MVTRGEASGGRSRRASSSGAWHNRRTQARTKEAVARRRDVRSKTSRANSARESAGPAKARMGLGPLPSEHEPASREQAHPQEAPSSRQRRPSPAPAADATAAPGAPRTPFHRQADPPTEREQRVELLRAGKVAAEGEHDGNEDEPRVDGLVAGHRSAEEDEQADDRKAEVERPEIGRVVIEGLVGVEAEAAEKVRTAIGKGTTCSTRRTGWVDVPVATTNGMARARLESRIWAVAAICGAATSRAMRVARATGTPALRHARCDAAKRAAAMTAVRRTTTGSPASTSRPARSPSSAAALRAPSLSPPWPCSAARSSRTSAAITQGASDSARPLL